MFGNTFDYSQNITQIDEIKFNVLGNNEVLARSVFPPDSPGITSSELHVSNDAKVGGLNDRRMGTTDNKFTCATCGLTMQYCDGHSGHITLASPIYHIGYYETVVNILNCVCLNCSNLLYTNSAEVNKINDKLKIIFLKSVSKNISVCKKCNYPVKTIKSIKKKDTTINIQVEISSSDENKKMYESIPTTRVFNILKNISDDDTKLLGLSSRPENLMYKVLFIPPIPVRPSVRGDFGTSHVKEDNLTMRLVNIFKSNNKTVKSIDSSKYEQTHIDLLQIEIALYFNNTSFTNTQSKGVVLKDLSSRIKGKDGRIRHNLMGKRVNYSARTVITPDPNLSINQLAVPLRIAIKLTYPEVVTPQNKAELEKYVQNGPNKYPGAKKIFKKSSNYIHSIGILQNKTYELNYGDIVERHLLDNDIVMFNRQPTLHKHGTLGHRIKILKNLNNNTFMFNPSVCKGYNADFDGDEMNLHTAQSVQTQIELEELTDVKLQIINPRMSLPIVGIVYDSLIGSYNLTRFTDKMSAADYMNLLTSVELNDIKNSSIKKYYSGTELYNNIIPKNINTKTNNVEIKDGDIVKGYISSDVLGNYKKNSLQQLILDEYNPNAAMDFLNNVMKLTINFNLINGFTISIGDFILSPEQKNNKNQVIETKLLEVEHEITEYENNPELLDNLLFEYSIFQKLDVTKNNMEKFIIDSVPIANNALTMLFSGSKGDKVKLIQIMCCRGQLDVYSSGKRMIKNFNNRGLPYFFQNDDRPKARAFITNSFMEGMSLSENLYEIMACREGLIDTAVKTADTGYIQRKLIKASEDFIVKYDGTVRNSMNKIQQFVYGDSGADTCKQYEYKLTFYEMNNDKIKTTFSFTNEELKTLKNYSSSNNEQFYDTIIYMRNNIREISVRATLIFKSYTSSFMIPVNLKRIVDNAINLKYDEKIIDDPKYILDQIDYILDSKNTLLIPMSTEEQKDSKSIKNEDEVIVKTLFKYALYDILAPKKSIIENKFTKSHLDYIVKNIILYFNKSMVDSGEMVGILAAQCLGEPLTQMTLKSFHFSGVGGKSSASQGIPRLKEIINVTKTNKIGTPTMNIYFDEKYRINKVYADKIAAFIKYTTIADIKDIIEIYYEPEPYDETGFIKQDNITKPFAPSQQSKISCSNKIDELPWLIRIKLNKEKLFLKEITLLDIKSKFCNFWEHRFSETKREKKKILERIQNLAILSNTDNDDIPIIHIRFDVRNPDINLLKDFMDVFIDNFKLKGIENIDDIIDDTVQEEPFIHFMQDTGDIVKKTENIIVSKGINLYDIRNIIGIDVNRSYTKDIMSVYENFGIEAVRNIIVIEMLDTFVKKQEQQNYQHVAIFADLMTNMGIVTQITHHGINKLDTDILSRATFERPVDQLIQASIFGEKDSVKSVSSNVLVGKCFYGGTGSMEILLDTEQIINSEYVYDPNNYNKNFNNITIKTEFETDENIFIPDF